jgi:hypothetical protein
MRDQDLPDSENIEDRRDDPPDETRASSKPELIYDEFRKIANSSDDDGQQGGISDEGGYSDIPRVSKTQQVVGMFSKGKAAGGPVQKQQSSLKRLTAHPIFPNVKILHARIPGLTSSSPDMKTVTINTHVPTSINVNGKRVPTAAPLAVFELYSRAGCEVFKEAAQAVGHQADDQDVQTCARRDVGEVAEKHFLEQHYGFTAEDWTAYCKIMQQGAGRQINQSATGG